MLEMPYTNDCFFFGMFTAKLVSMYEIAHYYFANCYVVVVIFNRLLL